MTMRTFLSRLIDLVLRRDREDRLRDEVQSHLDLLADEFVARGMTPEDARLAARRAFGGIDQMKDRYRDQRGFRWIEALMQDLRLGARLLVREPIFVIATASSLAIGIGATTTVFTIANGLLFSPPPGIADSDSLVDITRDTDGEGIGVDEVSFPNFLDLRSRATTLDDVCAYEASARAASLIADGESGAERVFRHNVTSNYFSVHGVVPAIGRFFDDRDADAAAVVLSHRFWTRRFDADPAVIGKTVRLNGEPVTVVGVASEAFVGTSMVTTEVWQGMSLTPPATSYRWQRGLFWALARGRVKEGVSRSTAVAEIETIGRALEQEHPESNTATRFRGAALSLLPGTLSILFGGILALIFAFVSLVLVAACANVASLLLARGTARQREVAVRLALGSSRGRLIRQLLTETCILFVIGGALGLVITRVAITALLSLLPGLPLPFELTLPIDVSVAAFAIVMALATAVAAGIAPALESTKADVATSLRNQSAGSSSRSRLRNAFVIVQVACGVVLIVGAALFTRAMVTAVSIDYGFSISGLQLADLDLSLARYDAITASAFMQRVTTDIGSNPAIDAVAIAAAAPDGGPKVQLGTVTLPEQPGRQQTASGNVVQPGYFSTLGIRLQRGRDFNASDDAISRPVAIISEEAARRFWPGQDPIGKSFLLRPNEIRRDNPGAAAGIERLVIGVVADTRDASGRTRPQVYLPLAQRYTGRLTLIARAANVDTAAAALRRAVESADPNVPITLMQTLESSMAAETLPRRLASAISGGLAAISLLLATIGVYGVAAYAAARQTKEIGIRVALGATAPAIRKLIAMSGLRLVAIGFGIGGAIAIVLARVLETGLAGFPRLDALSLAVALVVFSAVVITASWIPAMRASRIDPMISLRQE
jgi:putative ABC transport system permease protein